MTRPLNITESELSEILQLVLHRYDYDFSNYSHASLKRRIVRFAAVRSIDNIYDLKYILVNDQRIFIQFLQTIMLNVTEMFRDPLFYKTLREKILPQLATYPIIKIWHAGCATGEEVYSIAILLHEENLLERARIYATDINTVNLERARKGIIPLAAMNDYSKNYLEAGGKNHLLSYYASAYNNAIITKGLRKNIVFAHHNLGSDRTFNEFQLILCRNVLIYFDQILQNKVINLLYDSLSPLGFLALGMRESLLFTDLNSMFENVYPEVKIFKRAKI